jgi:thiamine-phosphate pyrophosphorylase
VATQSARTQIYLTVEAGPSALARLQAALGATPAIAAVLIRSGAAVLDAASARPLVEAVQKSDVAAIIEGDAALSRALRADGVHLPWSAGLRAAYDEAREILGNRFMVGVGIAIDAELARHDAMELAEAAADYIGFEPSGQGDVDAQAEFASWWAEIFQVPCVVFGVADAGAARNFAKMGVDFIGVDLPAGSSAADCAARVASIGEALATVANKGAIA